jgi:hypothetical protein
MEEEADGRSGSRRRRPATRVHLAAIAVED